MKPDFKMGQWKRDMNSGIPVIPEMFRIFNFWRMMKKMMKAARLYIYFPYGEISNKRISLEMRMLIWNKV